MSTRPHPSNPDYEALAFARGALTRRDLLRRAGAMGGMLAGANLLAACGGSVGGASTQSPGASTAATSYPHTVAPSWNWSNWTLYIDVKNHRHPSIDLFDKQFHTHTNYIEDINDNEEFFGKFQATLQAGQDIGRDLVTLTDWMAGKWVQFGYVDPLEWDILPNVQKNLLPAYKGRSIDPNDQYLVPWQSGLTGIGYNEQLTGRPLTTVSDLWDPKFKGKVSLLTEMRDTFGLVMLNLGIDPAQATVADAQKAHDAIKPKVDNGQIRAFYGNDYSNHLANGDLAAAMVWSGDMVQLLPDNPHLKFVVPQEGCMLWTDNMMIPKHAKNPYNAHLWMNFYYQPSIAALVEDWVNYICPVNGAADALKTGDPAVGLKGDPVVAKNPLIFPPKSTLDKAHVFKSLSPDEETKFNQLFADLTGTA
ncbi:MAG: polyamine ABC transporter substrate-binding protein [Gaiellales bacterium]